MKEIGILGRFEPFTAYDGQFCSWRLAPIVEEYLSTKKSTEYLSKFPRDIYHDTPTHFVILEADDKSGTYIIVEKETQRISFYVEYEILDLENLGTVCEICCYESRELATTSEYLEMDIIQGLQKKYKTIVSSPSLTNTGKAYWLGRINLLVTDGAKVGTYHIKSQNAVYQERDAKLSLFGINNTVLNNIHKIIKKSIGKYRLFVTTR